MTDQAARRSATRSVSTAGPGTQGESKPWAFARPWDSFGNLSSVHRTIEQFLADRPFERGPWAAVGFGAGIAAWVVLPGPWHWGAFLALCAAAAAAAWLIPRDGANGAEHVRQAIMAMALMLAAGCATIWAKAVLVAPATLPGATMGPFTGIVLDRQDQGAPGGDGGGRVRLVLRARIGDAPDGLTVRVSCPAGFDAPGATVGARISGRARLAPPARALLPGGYDPAFTAWFAGIGATGSVLEPITVTAPAPATPSLPALLHRAQAALFAHVLDHLSGSPGAIAAALASGDRGAIARADEDAMRDAGLTHLLSISGLHVSAVIAGVYLVTLRLLALFPWIALRVRLPVVAGVAGALAGIAYCLITGSEVPTVRSVAGALLALGAVMLGRNPLSLRLLAVAALLIMVFWPESVIGPSFQMSFASVAAIIALHNAAPVRAFLRHREEHPLIRLMRHAAMLLLSGLVIEVTLLPIALFHFHRAGIYGAAANLIAIPLTTFVTMPALGLALMFDLFGLGAPAWWVTGQSLDLLLRLAHWTAGLPGAVTLLPTMPRWIFGMMLAGLLWLCLWTGRVRLWGLVPLALAMAAYLTVRPPDILITGDARHVAITGLGPGLVLLNPPRTDTPGRTADTLQEFAATATSPAALDTIPGARCNRVFCALTLARANRPYVLLLARSKAWVPSEEIVEACARTDLTIAPARNLPEACRPRVARIDAASLMQTGGLTLDLATGMQTTVLDPADHHPWVVAAQPVGADPEWIAVPGTGRKTTKAQSSPDAG